MREALCLDSVLYTLQIAEIACVDVLNWFAFKQKMAKLVHSIKTPDFIQFTSELLGRR